MGGILTEDLVAPRESFLGRTVERGVTASHYFAIEQGIFRERLVSLQTVVTIGRDPQNDVELPDHSVSKRHALVLLFGGEYLIHDLGSLNGVFINGARIKKAVLRNGDTVKLGHTILRFIHKAESRGTKIKS